jgi:multiple RNA-binding domain-containing protein 1
MNLSYEVTQDEIRELFAKYGVVLDIEIPVGKRGRPLGIGFVRFETSEAAISAFAEVDKSFF